MNQEAKPASAVQAVLVVAGIVIIVAGVRAAASIIVPFLFAAFLAILCGPPLSWLGRRGIRRGMALVIVLVSVSVIGLGIATLLGSTVNRFVDSWPTTYQPRVIELTNQWNQWIDHRIEKLPWLDRLHYEDASHLWSQVAPEDVMSHFTTAISKLGGTLTNAFLILLTTIFLLAEATMIPAKLREISSGSERSVANFERIKTEVNHYMGIKTWTSSITGLSVTVGLALLNVDFALLWGVLAFMLNFVPTIGSILAAVPAVLLTLLQHGIGTACAAVILYVAVNVLVSTLLEPRWMGRGLNLSTLVVFLSLVFWGWVLGPVGMVISVPLTMTVKIVLEGHEETRRLGVLLSRGVSDGKSKQSDK